MYDRLAGTALAGAALTAPPLLVARPRAASHTGAQALREPRALGGSFRTCGRGWHWRCPSLRAAGSGHPITNATWSCAGSYWAASGASRRQRRRHRHRDRGRGRALVDERGDACGRRSKAEAAAGTRGKRLEGREDGQLAPVAANGCVRVIQQPGGDASANALPVCEQWCRCGGVGRAEGASNAIRGQWEARRRRARRKDTHWHWNWRWGRLARA